MMRCLIILIIIFFSTRVLSFSWQDFWHTPDQQGQLLMNKAQFEKAKETFDRTDWAATAAYKAGDYQKAAELYKGLKTEQGYYNQGNALAHMGQYEQAIEAYNKALSLNSNNQDAIYNRKLLQDLLKKDKDKQQNKDQKNKDQKNNDQKNKDQKNNDQKNNDQKNNNQKNNDQKNNNQKNNNQKNNNQKNNNQKNNDQKNNDQKNNDQKNNDQKNNDQKNNDQKNEAQQNTKKNQQEQKFDQSNKAEDNQEGEAQSEAEREKQQAKEQWLRLIPDDPGGLLREKFLRDHLRRERGWYQ